LALVVGGLGGAAWGGGSLGPGLWLGLVGVALLGLALLPVLAVPVRVAVCLAVAGLAVLTRPSGSATPEMLFGDLLTLGCTVAFGFSLLLADRWAQQHPALPLVFGQVAAMAGLSALMACFAGWQLDPGPALLWSALFCGVVATAVCLWGQTWALQRSTATRASLIYALEPVFAAGFAYLWRGDTLGQAEWVGGGLIVAATLVEPVRRMVFAPRAPELTAEGAPAPPSA
jgi:drug/metabolite transporter (DMT)-like permease